MDISVNARHFELDSLVRNYATEAVEQAFGSGDFRLKISGVKLMFDLQRSLYSARIEVAVKDHPVSAESSAYDNLTKAIDDAVSKAEVQIRRYLDKKQDHKKTVSLSNLPQE